jgi:CubicO group peptidase (beta-lactamase class C family)
MRNHGAASLLIGSLLSLGGPATARDDRGFPTATPESVGLSTASVRAIADEAAEYAKAGIVVGGELLIIKNKKIVLHEVHGFRDREDKRPMERNTIFNVRSMTKSLTGAAVQILVDEGKIRLDDPVAKYLPAFDNDKSRTITLEHLLEHRSGLPLTVITTKIDQYADLQAQAAAAGEKGPQFKPGDKFWYSDAGSDCAAAVVERVTGATIDRFVTERILQPVGMVDSFYPTKADDPRTSRIASLYLGTPGTWNRFWKPGGPPMYPFAWGSQTLYSTPVDYARFLAMWLDGGNVGGKPLISPAAMKRILTPSSSMSMLGSDAPFPTGFHGMKAFYGQMSVLHAAGQSPQKAKVIAFGHSGSDGTVAWAFPVHDLIVCYFTQSRGQLTAIRMESILDRELLHPGNARVLAPEALKPYLGVYYANFGHYKNAPFKIVFQNDHLSLDIPDQLVFELNGPGNDSRWTFAVSEQITVGFTKDSDGKVVSMNLKQPGSSVDLPNKPAQVQTLNKDAVERYLGKYQREEDKSIVEVTLKDGALRVYVPGTGQDLELAQRADMKSWEVRAAPGRVLTFQEGEDGTVTSFTVELPDGKKLVRKRLGK